MYYTLIGPKAPTWRSLDTVSGKTWLPGRDPSPGPCILEVPPYNIALDSCHAKLISVMIYKAEFQTCHSKGKTSEAGGMCT